MESFSWSSHRAKKRNPPKPPKTVYFSRKSWVPMSNCNRAALPARWPGPSYRMPIARRLACHCFVDRSTARRTSTPSTRRTRLTIPCSANPEAPAAAAAFALLSLLFLIYPGGPSRRPPHTNLLAVDFSTMAPRGIRPKPLNSTCIFRYEAGSNLGTTGPSSQSSQSSTSGAQRRGSSSS